MLPNAKVGDFLSTGGPGGAKRVLGSGCRVLAYSSQSVEGFARTQHPKPRTRQGLAAEAARAAPEYAFDAGLFRRIYARTDVPNSASVPAMERLGMKFERERVAHYRHTRILDVRAPFWRAPAPTSHYGVQTSMFPVPYRCTPAKFPCPKNSFTHPGNFPNTRNPLQTNHFPSPRPIGTPLPPARRARLRPGNSTYPPLG